VSEGVGGSGRPGSGERYHRLVARRPAGEVRHVRAALAAGPPLRPAFTEVATTVLAGIAVLRGEPWEAVVDRRTPPASRARPARS
jgi:hypothetical protein